MRSFYKYGNNEFIHSTKAYLILHAFFSGSTSFMYLKNLSFISSFLKNLAIIEAVSKAFILTISILSTMNLCQISRASVFITFLGATFV